MELKFSDAQRAEFSALQTEIKYHLVGVERIVAIWALTDLAYYLATNTGERAFELATATTLRNIADKIENSDG